MAEVTIKKANSKKIKGGHTKYGFQIEHPKLGDEWINVVDWDNVHKGKEFSPGDTVDITKPEQGDYGWEANFNQVSQGFDDEEVDNFTLNRIINGIRENYKLLVKIAKKQGIDTPPTGGHSDDIDYPEPTKDELNQTFGEESIDDIDW